MWKLMSLSMLGAAAVWNGGASFAVAQGYVPPTPYAAPYQNPILSPSTTSVPTSAPYSEYVGTMSAPAVSGGYVAGNTAASGYATTGAGPGTGVGPFWAPGGYEARMGSPYLYHDPNGGQFVTTGNPYYDHYGPGFHRSQLYGHYRFPYYNYRAPWYYPGRAVYNRDTNLHW